MLVYFAVFDSQGKPTGEFRFDAAGANRALESIGKHTSINAFRYVEDNGKPIDLDWNVMIIHCTKEELGKSKKLPQSA